MPRKMRSLAERYWPKVDVRGPDECWPWLASKCLGYGQIGRGGRGNGMVRSHRVAYELLVGPIPAGLFIDHLCRNRACQNPAHMEPVTTQVNLLRGIGVSARNAAKTHCPSGHPYDADNTHITPDGGRKCRECNRRRQSSHPVRVQRFSLHLRKTG